MFNPPAQPLDAWEARHTVALLAFTLAAVALLRAGVAVPPAAQIAGLAIAVAVLGLPHGAFDAVIGEDLLRPTLGRSWGVWFTAGYLGLAGGVIALWVISPLAALWAFFAAAAWHFGTTDARRADAPSGLAWAVEAAGRGAMPIALPAAYHPAETAAILRAVLPGPTGFLTADAVAAAAGWACLLVIPVLLAAFAWHARAALTAKSPAARQSNALAAFELVALVLLFAAAPVLVGFILYFCGWHSPRHELHLVSRVNPGRPWAGLREVLLRSLPATGLTVLLAAGAFWLLTRSGPPTAATLRVVFIGLSALTVPHMVLEVLADGSLIAGGGSPGFLPGKRAEPGTASRRKTGASASGY